MTFASNQIGNIFPFKRAGGILLHPTSLPSKYGIGDLGSDAYRFLDFLKVNNLKLWQILPLGITGYGNCPYSSFSSFAGNPFIIDPDTLVSEGLLSKDEVEHNGFDQKRVEYGKVISYKWKILELAFDNYQRQTNEPLRREFESFKQEEIFWLEDFAIFMSIKSSHDMKPWNLWDDGLKFRKKSVIRQWKSNHSSEIEFQKFVQFLFFKQWDKVKDYAHRSGINIIGDIPIFVAYDSADVWSNPGLFYLTRDRELLYVSGVPPDYFSKTGQRWGTPLYRWNIHKKRHYRWWFERIKHIHSMVDIIRIDHFRGFEAFWRIPASRHTAEIGKWIPGPGYDFFRRMRQKLGSVPLIAEDLGLITPKVVKLLERTGFPRMSVLQFAFGSGNKNRFLPHNYTPNTIVYTGTHDNETTFQWFQTTTSEVQQYVLDYTASNGEDIVGDLIRLAWSSTAIMSIIPLQDLMRLGSGGRMNYPGTTDGNWEWRFTWNQLKPENGMELRNLSRLYNR